MKPAYCLLFLVLVSCETLDRFPLRKVQAGKKEFQEGWSTCPKSKENETAVSKCNGSLFSDTVFLKVIVPTPSDGSACLEQCKSLRGENGFAKLLVESLPANPSLPETSYPYPKIPGSCLVRKSPPAQVYKTGIVKIPSSVTKKKDKKEHCSCNLFIQYEKGESEFASTFRRCLDEENISRKDQENFYYKYRY